MIKTKLALNRTRWSHRGVFHSFTNDLPGAKICLNTPKYVLDENWNSTIFDFTINTLLTLFWSQQNGFTTTATAEKPYSIDANLMHISYESGVLEDPFNEPPTSMFDWTRTPDQLPANTKPTILRLQLQDGLPIKVEVESDGRTVDRQSLEIMKLLNQVGAEQGVGRIDIVEDRFIGMKSRGVYETPGATILFHAVADLRTVCIDKVSTLFIFHVLLSLLQSNDYILFS